MVKVAEIISKVEYVKDGESLCKTPAEYKALYDKRRQAKLPVEDTISPIKQELAKIQDRGLSQVLPELPEAKLVGK